MDIQRKCFEESNNVNPDWSFKFDEELQQYIALDSEMELHVDEFNELWDAFRAGWQAAKAQAVPDGFVVVPKEPYAYLIKHKFWQKGSDPEIFLAEDFLGDDGVEKDKLTVCIPLYLGDDEAQESAND